VIYSLQVKKIIYAYWLNTNVCLIYQIWYDRCSLYEGGHRGRISYDSWIYNYIYYTLRFYFPYVSLLAQPINILVYW